MNFTVALGEFQDLLRDIREARSPRTYPEEPTVNSLFLNASNLIHAYKSLLRRDFSKQLSDARGASGNGYYKLSHLEPFVADIIKQLERNAKLSGYDKIITHDDAQKKITSKAIDIIRLLNDQTYVNSQFELLRNTIDNSPRNAIGSAKELIETCCKGILDHFKIQPKSDWDLLKLAKETSKVLNFGAELQDENFCKSIQMVTNGLSNIVHGISEIRNRYGSGHGHPPDFKELDKAYTHLVVFSAIEWITFYLRIFDAQKKIAHNRSIDGYSS